MEASDVKGEEFPADVRALAATIVSNAGPLYDWVACKAILAERDACAKRYRDGAGPNTWDYFKEAEDAINPPR